VDMNFVPDRIAKIAARQGAALKARPEMQRHLEHDPEKRKPVFRKDHAQTKR
jgi:hypothetical protein